MASNNEKGSELNILPLGIDRAWESLPSGNLGLSQKFVCVARVGGERTQQPGDGQ